MHSISWQEVVADQDRRDPLAPFREQFYLPRGKVYMDGNSLGLLSRPAEAAVLRVLEDWKRLGIDGWSGGSPPWYWLAESLGAEFAPLIGAEPEEVIVTNSTTVNLHQLLATLFQPDGGRTRILSDSLSFPSDTYAIRSHLRVRGLDPEGHFIRVESRDGYTLEEADIVSAMTPEVAIAVLPAVIYTSGQLLDIAGLTEEAHRRGLLVGFDCSHSVGVVPHRLSEWGVDFAFWCGYKYLNGGPGAAAGLYLNRRHFDAEPGLAGWFGSHKERQFDMSPTLEAGDGAGALQIGSPNILSMAPLMGSLEILGEAGIARIRAKSVALTEQIIWFADEVLAAYGMRVVTPRAEHRRGGHVALAHPEAARICKALRAAGVVPDYRPPDIVRLAPVPLYVSFADCATAMDVLRGVMDSRAYENYPPGREQIA